MAITLHELEIKQETDLRTIINNFSSHTDKVKFAIFAAKDCFHLCDDDIKPLTQKCIQLVESWIANPDSVHQKKLLNASYAVYCSTRGVNTSYVATADVVRAASWTANAAVYIYGSYAYHAAFYAVSAFLCASRNDHNIYDQKLTQYIHYAYSLLRSTTTTNLQTQGKITDKATLMALLDELQDLNENIILYQNNKVVLNHPTNFATNTLPELVNLIWNNASLLHYLEHLYT